MMTADAPTTPPPPPLASNRELRLFSDGESHTVVVVNEASPRKSVACNTSFSTAPVATPVALSVDHHLSVQKKPKVGPSKIVFLNGVRGLGAFLVVLQHSGYGRPVNLGAAGVDTFFVLSSFLLTMIMERKCRQLLEQSASAKTWCIAMADYFMKRFLRVYPLFAANAIVLALLPDRLQDRYFYTHSGGEFNLFKVLTFQTEWRYHLLWTLPLEITYYFFIPVFVVIVVKLKTKWWVPFLPLYVWVSYQGITTYRWHHQPLMPHFPTFLSGSMAAIIYVNIDSAMKQRSFTLRPWHKLLIKAVQYAILGLILSICTKALYFDWLFKNPVPEGPGGYRYIGVFVTMVIVLEMISPGEISRLFEWGPLRHWGKISFSVYLLHVYVINTPAIRKQHNWADIFCAEFGLVTLLATTTYYLIEYPSQLLANRLSRALNARNEIWTQGHLKAVVKYEPVVAA